jgi:hypothetical protein
MGFIIRRPKISTIIWESIISGKLFPACPTDTNRTRNKGGDLANGSRVRGGSRVGGMVKVGEGGTRGVNQAAEGSLEGSQVDQIPGSGEEPVKAFHQIR